MKTEKSKKTSYGARTGTKKKPHFGIQIQNQKTKLG